MRSRWPSSPAARQPLRAAFIHKEVQQSCHVATAAAPDARAESSKDKADQSRQFQRDSRLARPLGLRLRRCSSVEEALELTTGTKGDRHVEGL
ncbi:unnamed protein product, partial [Polarella glacialis]